MSWWFLILIIFLTWCLWALATMLQKAAVDAINKVPKDRRGGVSIALVIPLFPLLLFGAAKVADRFLAPWGTGIILWLHLLLAIPFLVSIARDWIRLRSLHSSE